MDTKTTNSVRAGFDSFRSSNRSDCTGIGSKAYCSSLESAVATSSSDGSDNNRLSELYRL